MDRDSQELHRPDFDLISGVNLQRRPFVALLLFPALARYGSFFFDAALSGAVTEQSPFMDLVVCISGFSGTQSASLLLTWPHER